MIDTKKQKYHPEHRNKRFKNERDFSRWLSTKATFKISFKDFGQDCLAWYIDNGGEVLHAEPFQASVWSGYCVDLASLREDKEISVVGNQVSREPRTFDFVVSKIERV